MKKISLFLVLIIVLSACASLFVSAVGYNVPTLVHEPATVTVKPGSKAVLKTVASGKDLHFSWTVEVYPNGTFDLSKEAGVKGLEKLDNKGKMKVSMKTYNSGTDEVTAELIIDGVIETNYGIACVCTVANSDGAKDTDTAFIYTSEQAPPQPEVDLVAELDVRIGKLIKLACNVYPADENYVGIEYRWYTTPDGDKSKAELIEGENDPVLVVDTGFGGIYFYFCTFYILKEYSDFYYESGVTMIRIHEPIIDVTYGNDISLDIGQSATLKANVTVDPEKDLEGGKLSYQWYKGTNNIVGTFEKISGATSDTLKVTGADSAGKMNYFCEVTLKSAESHEFSSLTSDAAFVTVTSTGKQKKVEITKDPADCTVKENDEASFSIESPDAVDFAWYMIKTDGKQVLLKTGDEGVFGSANKATLKISAKREYDGCRFYCVAYGENGTTDTSTSAKLTVTVEETKPEETKPEETKPEETKPEETKPEETKPEETKPENTKPGETKPEETKPGLSFNESEKTIILVVAIIICVLITVLIVIGIVVLVKFGKKKK